MFSTKEPESSILKANPQRTMGGAVWRVAAAITLAVSALASGCAQPQQESRVYEPETASLQPYSDETLLAALDVRIERLVIDLRPEGSEVHYNLGLGNGRRFSSHIRQTIQRDGAETVVTLTDLDSQDVISVAIAEEASRQVGSGGSTADITANADVQKIAVTSSLGEVVSFDYAGVPSGSDQEMEMDSELAVSILGATEMDEDQVNAIGASLSAASEDLGTGGMDGWYWFNKGNALAVRWHQFLCNDYVRKGFCGVGGLAGGSLLNRGCNKVWNFSCNLAGM